MLTQPFQMSGDFRFDVLKSLVTAKQGRLDLSPMIHTYVNEEGHSHIYYVEILEEMLERKFIYLNVNELKRFKELYNGAFAEFPLITKIKPAGIDEYHRIKIQKRDVVLSNPRFIILLISAIVAVFTLLLTIATRFHWIEL